MHRQVGRRALHTWGAGNTAQTPLTRTLAPNLTPTYALTSPACLFRAEHCMGLSRSGLPVGEDAHVIALQYARHALLSR